MSVLEIAVWPWATAFTQSTLAGEIRSQRFRSYTRRLPRCNHRTVGWFTDARLIVSFLPRKMPDMSYEQGRGKQASGRSLSNQLTLGLHLRMSSKFEDNIQQAATTPDTQTSRLVVMLLDLDDRFDKKACFYLARYIASRDDFAALPSFGRAITLYHYAGGLCRAGTGDMGVQRSKDAIDALLLSKHEMHDVLTGEKDLRKGMDDYIRLMDVRRACCEAELESRGHGPREEDIPAVGAFSSGRERCQSHQY